jgi:hypothetical protein
VPNLPRVNFLSLRTNPYVRAHATASQRSAAGAGHLTYCRGNLGPLASFPEARREIASDPGAKVLITPAAKGTME